MTVFIKDSDISWENAKSFEARVTELIEKKATQGEEFQTYLKLYGRQKLEEIYRKSKGTKQGDT